MNLSGILLTAEPAGLQDVLARLATVPGAEVAQAGATSGRIVVVQEAADVGAELLAFARLRSLPHVINADLVCHCLDADGDGCPPGETDDEPVAP